MTASLPVPHEPLPDDPDGDGAPASDGRLVEFVKNPRNSSEKGSRPTSSRAKRAPKPRAPRTRTPQVVAPDPGPPPPLPAAIEVQSAAIPPKPDVPVATTVDADRALPPKPPVPAHVAAAAAAAAAAELAAATPQDDDADSAREISASVTVDTHAAVPDAEIGLGEPQLAESEPLTEPELVTEAEPEPEAEVVVVTEPELEVASAPEPEAQPVVVAEPELVTEPELKVASAPEAVIVSDPEPEAQPVVVAEPELVTEPELEVASDPEPVVEPDPAVAETESETIVLPVDAPAYADLIDVAPDLVAATPIEVEPDANADADPLAYVYEQARLEASLDEESSALVLRGVSKSFGDMTAVEAIDLTVPAGTFYGLVGPNGAGKTTTLSMIAGLLTPDRGVIRVGGVDAASEPLAAKKLMGVLPDRLRTFDRLTGRQLLYYYGVLRGLPARVVESRSADLARAFDLTDALGRVVSDYSAGMLKKVMLAGAMIHSPRVLVLDEPFESVDPVSSAVILDILSAYVAHGGTVILSSHGMELVERVCTRVAVIVAGQVLAEGTIDEVRGELTLEQRFVELAGGLSDVEGLEWLHTFSD